MEVGFDSNSNLIPDRQLDGHKINCPHCQKQYLIFLKDLHEEANRFVCKACMKDFWLRRSDFEQSARSTTVAVEPPPVATKSEEYIGKIDEKCPKCGGPVQNLEQACGSCGVIGRKYLALRESTPYLRVSESLRALWKRVLNHYEDDQIHHEFLSQCLKEKQLRYAALNYKQVQDVLGADQTALEMIAKIQNLTALELEKQKAAQMGASPAAAPSSPVKKFVRWEFFFFGIGALCVLTGLASPLVRNLISLGVMFFAMPFLIKMFLKK